MDITEKLKNQIVNCYILEKGLRALKRHKYKDKITNLSKYQKKLKN